MLDKMNRLTNHVFIVHLNAMLRPWETPSKLLSKKTLGDLIAAQVILWRQSPSEDHAQNTFRGGTSQTCILQGTYCTTKAFCILDSQVLCIKRKETKTHIHQETADEDGYDHEKSCNRNICDRSNPNRRRWRFPLPLLRNPHQP